MNEMSDEALRVLIRDAMGNTAFSPDGYQAYDQLFSAPYLIRRVIVGNEIVGMIHDTRCTPDLTQSRVWMGLLDFISDECRDLAEAQQYTAMEILDHSLVTSLQQVFSNFLQLQLDLLTSILRKRTGIVSIAGGRKKPLTDAQIKFLEDRRKIEKERMAQFVEDAMDWSVGF